MIPDDAAAMDGPTRRDFAKQAILLPLCAARPLPGRPTKRRRRRRHGR